MTPFSYVHAGDSGEAVRLAGERLHVISAAAPTSSTWTAGLQARLFIVDTMI